MYRAGFIGVLAGLWMAVGLRADDVPGYVARPGWPETMAASRVAVAAELKAGADREAVVRAVWDRIHDDFPVETDWMLQDAGPDAARWLAGGDAGLERDLVKAALEGAGPSSAPLQAEAGALEAASVPAGDPRWLALYARAGEARRAIRLRTLLARAPRIVFTKHRTVRPSFFAYTEGQSDAQAEKHFLPGAELCLLEMDGTRARVRTLLADPEGAIRDPAVSWDGRRVLFAWKKSRDGDDYHIYDMDPASGATRAVTSGRGFADYEPCWLPDGGIVFSSTRCVQTVDCFWTEVSNLYACEADGRFLRRLGFDQVHTIFPQVLDDGRVVYTRWDYNDRGQVFPQGLFQMNPDGSGQAEFYGNNSWFPTTTTHARGIPGTGRVLAILCGHHSTQAGKLAVIDPSKGRQENEGVQLVAPVRETKAERIDAYGQQGELFQYPYPLNERELVTAYAPSGWNLPRKREGDADFAIYWFDLDGRRELLAADPRLPCQSPVPLAPRPTPPSRPSAVDYTRADGTYYVQDVYAGPGVTNVGRGTIRSLRVVALDFRAAGIGSNGSHGPAGGALACTPISTGNGAWDVKIVLGEVPVCADGSVFFRAPARTPLYFQLLDERGCAVQTMRSWSTLQPGENQSCAGCHESKNTTPPAALAPVRMALQRGPEALRPPAGGVRGFSFAREVQPLLDRHCIRCHSDREALAGRWAEPPVRAPAVTNAGAVRAFSLLGAGVEDPGAKRVWSDAYLALTGSMPRDRRKASVFMGANEASLVNWPGAQSVPSMLPPRFAGAARSGLMKMLEGGHAGVKLTRGEQEAIACWIDLAVPFCGDYTEANLWSDAEKEKYARYLAKRRSMEEIERANVADFMRERGRRAP